MSFCELALSCPIAYCVVGHLVCQEVYLLQTQFSLVLMPFLIVEHSVEMLCQLPLTIMQL